jgi:hypothetical protein
MNVVGFRVSTSLAICWIALFASAILATPVVAAQSRGETQGAYSRSNDTAVARSRQRNPDRISMVTTSHPPRSLPQRHGLTRRPRPSHSILPASWGERPHSLCRRRRRFQ